MVSESVVDVAAGPDPVVVDPVVTAPVVDVVAGPDPVPVDPVIPEPVVEVAAGPEPVVTEPVVEVVAGPVPVVEPVSPEPIINVAAGPSPVVEVAARPAPVVEPVVSAPVAVAAGSTPVVDPVVSDPVVVAGPVPVSDPIATEPVVKMATGSGPVVNPVVTEPVIGAPHVHVGATRTSSPGVEQTLVASLHQRASVGPEMSSPVVLSQDPLNDKGGGQVDAAHTAGQSIDVQSEPGLTADMTVPGQTSVESMHVKGAEQPTVSESSKNQSTVSTMHGKINLDPGSTDERNWSRFTFDQGPWPPAAEEEKVPDDSGGLAMPMAVGLMGAILQGSSGKKEKLAALNAKNPTRGQEPAKTETSQQPSTDDRDAPPSAA